MSSFAAWGLTILGLAVVTTVAEMLLPQGKTRNVIRSAAAAIAALVIITPLPNILKNGFDYDFSGDSVHTDSDYLEYVDGIKADYFAKSAEEYLASKGYSDAARVTVTVDGWKVKTVTVNFSDMGMPENGAHINKSEIIKLVADYFGIGEEAVMSYG